jgi:hypothetical protein
MSKTPEKKIPATIERRKPVIDDIFMPPDCDQVVWTIDDKEGTDFVIKFDGVDPLEEAPPHESVKRTFTGTIKKSIPRGKGKHYPYRIMLVRTEDEAGRKDNKGTRSDSPPEMVIQ